MPGKPHARGDRRRDAILAFVEEYWAAHRYGPSFREIAEGTGLGHPSSAAYEVGILIDGGVLQRAPGVARSVRVVEEL